MDNNTEVRGGIGGWLILPAIGFALSPLLGVVGIIRHIAFLVGEKYDSAVTLYSGLDLLTVFELFGTFVLWVFVCIVAYSFFKKKPATPKKVILYIKVALTFAAIRFIWGLAIFGVDDSLILISLLRSSKIISIGLTSAIWIPYFRRSKRVKATFVK